MQERSGRADCRRGLAAPTRAGGGAERTADEQHDGDLGLRNGGHTGQLDVVRTAVGEERVVGELAENRWLQSGGGAANRGREARREEQLIDAVDRVVSALRDAEKI